MKPGRLRARAAALIAAAGLIAGAVTLTAGAAMAASCPAVDPNTGAVSPAPAPGVDWSGCDLTGADLHGADLTNATLNGANLHGANLAGAVFTGADLTGVRSGGIAWASVTLPAHWGLYLGYLWGPGADLSNVTLQGDVLIGLDLNGANLAGANFRTSNLNNTDFTGADLKGADLSYTVMTGAIMAGADLTGTIMQGADLGGLDFSGDTMTNANLNGAQLGSTNLTGADLSGGILTGAALLGTNLTGANLTGANLGSANFSGTNLSGTNLSGVSLANAQSKGITGTPASLPAHWSLVTGHLIGPSAYLAGADLTGADLTGADLANARLDAATLTGATLTHADLTGANLTMVVSGGITGTPSALPAGWALIGGYLAGPNANLYQAGLAGANLSHLDLTYANLYQANLHNANVDAATLTHADLQGVISGGLTGVPVSLPPNWHVQNGYLIGAGADLTGANLAGLVLASGQLSGTIFTSANLSGANLNSASAGGATFTGADLTGADLTRATLAGAVLDKADLTGATLTGVVSGHVTGTPAVLPAHWSLVNGYLIGPRANLAQAGLAGADLTGTDLTWASLSSADLSNANLTGADLTGSDLTKATLSGITWSNTTCPDGSNSDSHSDGCLSALDTPPTAVPAASGTRGFDNWFTADPTITWNWADLRGTVDPAACPATTTSTGEGNPLTVTATCTNTDGVQGHAAIQVQVDKAPPQVSVTGVSSGRKYVYGKVPSAGCSTSDSLSGVATPATLKVTTTGKGGTGPFTATCSGAADWAGNQQGSAVSASYTVVYGFGGFASPKPQATLATSAGKIAVKFRLTNSAGTPISATRAAALATAKKVHATLRGPGISAVTATCTWNGTTHYFQCTITTPASVTTGSSVNYTITASENTGGGFTTAPAVGTAVNPETIHFK